MSGRYEEDADYSRDRSRSRDRDDEEYGHHQNNARNNQQEETENFTLHVHGLKSETSDDVLKVAFEKLGEVKKATIVREPVQRTSRGFAFVTMMKVEDSVRALNEMNGAEIDGKTIEVKKARRTEGYEKTPGVYLGPPQVSTKYNRRDGRRDRERGRDRDDRDRRGPARGDSHDYRDDRDRDYREMRRDSRERYSRDPRDYYDRYPPMRPIPGTLLPPYDRAPMYRDERYAYQEELYRREPRYDIRDPRAVPSMLVPPDYDPRARSPPRGEYRSRSPHLEKGRPMERPEPYRGGNVRRSHSR